MELNRGSEWRRWEPHIHAPGTTMNNQFTGPTAWEDYLTALEKATPAIEAIAVTDYYVTDTYEEVLRHKTAGRLPDAELIFPNVELRLDVATAKGGFVNLHLFVSPEDPKHVEELQRLLSRLQFNVMQDRFDCTRADLIRLGKAADPKITDDRAALAYGANQFKVNFQKLREVFGESAWAKKNILIAVAGGADDGTSGVREAADQTIRREIETFAHVIFASSAAQREFWLGQRQLSAIEIHSLYGGLKPCLHGSDAHKLEDVASPFGDRFSWIKGGLEFDALCQACIDPQGRAHVGTEPPASATPSQVICQVEILNAEWAETPVIPLNPGLVAIIGARGSGKTALADMIAAGCDSITDEAWNANEWANPSLLVRARPLLGDSKVKVSWAAGDPVERSLDGADANGPYAYERVRYLSQQFVEELCSSSGLTDGLMREIERVIFEAHPDHEREGALDFEELLNHRATRHRLAREREAEAVAQISDRISAELEKEKMAATYESQAAQKIAELKGVPPVAGDPNTPCFPDDTDLSKLSQAMLDAEMSRLEKLVSDDKDIQRRYTALSGNIATETAALQTLTDKLKEAQGAKGRAKELQTEREEAYGRAFDALVAEQSVLETLYAPLMARLAAASGTLKKLSFSVARVVNVEQWASEAEDGLIDLRKAGAFRGKGTLLQKATEVLKGAWETGDAAAVRTAMAEFRKLYQKALLDHSPMAHTEQAEFRAWSKRFAQWLFSTDHISIRYGIDYDGVDIRKLSPGTRGIVLLLLYLALDDTDNRPLVIDQPEENLDPKSVFDELVHLFIDAKAHRQVIIVTHNANLVINTDADQIIIAEAGPHPHGKLPPITYRSGGLENAEIRKAVCDILEGGEGAFQERARRLRVRLER